MKLTRVDIRRMILEAMVNDLESEETEGEVVDLFKHPKFKGDLDTFQRVRTQDTSKSRDDEEEMDREFKKYIQSLPDDYEDPEDEEEYMAEQKGGGAYSGYFGMEMPYGDEIDEGDEEDQSQHMLDLQLQLQKDVEGEKTGGTIARQSVRQDQQAIANLADK
jgi:hypothetical protein